MVHCIACGKDVLDRALEEHYRSRGHRKAEEAADEVVCTQLRIESDPTTSAWPPSESVIDPLLITTWLFLQVNKVEIMNGPEDREWVVQPYSPSYDLLQLEGLALRTLNRYLKTEALAHTPELLISVANMATVAAMIGGWDHGRPHRRAIQLLRATCAEIFGIMDSTTMTRSLVASAVLGWSSVQQALDVVDTDTLIILDCCHAGHLSRTLEDDNWLDVWCGRYMHLSSSETLRSYRARIGDWPEQLWDSWVASRSRYANG